MSQFAATILEHASRSVAGIAASQLLEEHADLARHFRPGEHRGWQDFFQARIDELAAALLVEDRQVFETDIRWTKSLFLSRDVPVKDLRRAIRVLRAILEEQLPEQVFSSLQPYMDAAEAVLSTDGVQEMPGLQVDTPQGRLAGNFLRLVLEGERWEACQLVLRAMDDGMAVSDVYQDILLPVTREVGRMWHTGEINVAEEHFATATTELVMSQLFSRMQRKARNDKTVIVSAAQGNQHSVAVRYVSDFFEMAGWRVIYLGGDMPPRDLAQATVDFEADLVALSVTMSRHLRATKSCIDAIRQTQNAKHIKILIGGLALSQSARGWTKLGADGYAQSGPEAVSVGARLVGIS